MPRPKRLTVRISDEFSQGNTIICPGTGVGKIRGVYTDNVGGYELQLCAVDIARPPGSNIPVNLEIPLNRLLENGIYVCPPHSVLEKALLQKPKKLNLEVTRMGGDRNGYDEIKGHMNSGDVSTIVAALLTVGPRESYAQRQVWEYGMRWLAPQLSSANRMSIADAEIATDRAMRAHMSLAVLSAQGRFPVEAKRSDFDLQSPRVRAVFQETIQAYKEGDINCVEAYSFLYMRLAEKKKRQTVEVARNLNNVPANNYESVLQNATSVVRDRMAKKDPQWAGDFIFDQVSKKGPQVSRTEVNQRDLLVKGRKLRFIHDLAKETLSPVQYHVWAYSVLARKGRHKLNEVMHAELGFIHKDSVPNALLRARRNLRQALEKYKPKWANDPVLSRSQLDFLPQPKQKDFDSDNPLIANALKVCDALVERGDMTHKQRYAVCYYRFSRRLKSVEEIAGEVGSQGRDAGNGFIQTATRILRPELHARYPDQKDEFEALLSKAPIYKGKYQPEFEIDAGRLDMSDDNVKRLLEISEQMHFKHQYLVASYFLPVDDQFVTRDEMQENLGVKRKALVSALSAAAKNLQKLVEEQAPELIDDPRIYIRNRERELGL